MEKWADYFTKENKEENRPSGLPIRILALEKAGIEALCARPKAADCAETVKSILEKVRQEGDAALEFYSRQFDKVQGDYAIRVPAQEIEEAYLKADKSLIEALVFAKSQIEKVCIKTKPKDKKASTRYATITQKIVPIESVGIYAPGGTAAYPSTVLMCAIPAKVAGVEKIILCSSPQVAPSVLVAAKICGISEVFAIGGAQAVAAMAYGTKTVPKVEKIVGPGNQYVTEAKKQVRGQQTDIDMLAGPTEVFIVADDSAKPDFVAADMIAQLEHGPDSAAITIMTEGMAGKVAQELERQAVALPRREIVNKSMRNSVILTTDFANLQAVADAINAYAPEHLEIQVNEAVCKKLLALVKNAGAVFVGEKSCEALGDYCAGSNHVLPTGGSAKFSSGLSVANFTKIIEVIKVLDVDELAKNTGIIAKAEGLEGHARSAGIRLSKR